MFNTKLHAWRTQMELNLLIEAGVGLGPIGFPPSDSVYPRCLPLIAKPSVSTTKSCTILLKKSGSSKIGLVSGIERASRPACLVVGLQTSGRRTGANKLSGSVQNSLNWPMSTNTIIAVINRSQEITVWRYIKRRCCFGCIPITTVVKKENIDIAYIGYKMRKAIL